MGADYVEPDLVSTKDGVLVARHENLISGTTNVADHPEFAARQTTKTIDSTAVTGWFTEDFTLAELKTLRAKERLPLVRPRTRSTTGASRCPRWTRSWTWCSRSPATHRRIGVYPETKHPTYFRSIGLPLERPLLAALRQARMDRQGSKVFLQSFETGNLRRLNRMTRLPIIQLLDATGAPWDLRSAGDPRTYKDLTTPRELRRIAAYADGIGPNKDLVLPRDANGDTCGAQHARPPTPIAPAWSCTCSPCAGEPVHGPQLPGGDRPQRHRRPRRRDPRVPGSRESTACSATTPTSP